MIFYLKTAKKLTLNWNVNAFELLTKNKANQSQKLLYFKLKFPKHSETRISSLTIVTTSQPSCDNSYLLKSYFIQTLHLVKTFYFKAIVINYDFVH